MSGQKKWDELYEAASQEILRWPHQHKKASLTEIEDRFVIKSVVDPGQVYLDRGKIELPLG